MTVLLVEQNAHVALERRRAHTCSRSAGLCSTGTSEELRRDKSVRRSYLGY